MKKYSVMCYTCSAICLIALFSLPELKLYEGKHFELVRIAYLVLGIVHFVTFVCPFVYWITHKIKNKLTVSVVIEMVILTLFFILWFTLFVQPAISTFLRYKTTINE